jgi:hypothetical protein
MTEGRLTVLDGLATTGVLQPALRAFLEGHDQACADWGRDTMGEGGKEFPAASFAAFAEAAEALADAITAGPGHPVLEAMASAVSLYREAATWASWIRDARTVGDGTERDVSDFGQPVMLRDTAEGEVCRRFGMFSCDARDRWAEWAPRFFELVALPAVPAPKVWPTYP